MILARDVIIARGMFSPTRARARGYSLSRIDLADPRAMIAGRARRERTRIARRAAENLVTARDLSSRIPRGGSTIPSRGSPRIVSLPLCLPIDLVSAVPGRRGGTREGASRAIESHAVRSELGAKVCRFVAVFAPPRISPDISRIVRVDRRRVGRDEGRSRQFVFP